MFGDATKQAPRPISRAPASDRLVSFTAVRSERKDGGVNWRRGQAHCRAARREDDLWHGHARQAIWREEVALRGRRLEAMCRDAYSMVLVSETIDHLCHTNDAACLMGTNCLIVAA